MPTRHALFLLLLLMGGATTVAAAEDRRELWLAGGSLKLCSDLDPGSCRTPPPRTATRQAPRYVVDAESVLRGEDPLLWSHPGAPPAATIGAMLRHAQRAHGTRGLTRRAMQDALDAVRLPARFRQVRRGGGEAPGAVRPWRGLLDDERAAVLSALELPQVVAGVRATERAYPQLSRPRGGVAVAQGFVDAARRRAGGATPRIAVVTASAQDPFDAVDFYLDLFASMGAQAQWWPIDAALEQAVAAGQCGALEALRRQHLQLANRDRVYPDLARLQQQACEAPLALAELPQRVHGVFFSGGDQWRLRQALVDAHDQPNAWLQALQHAHAAGTLVVGGTSAGAAVQSGAAMVSNGSTASALAPGPVQAPPPPPGCARAGRCAPGLDEDSVTWWPAGGTGLATDASVDTHFSERGRELRLLALMQVGDVRWGFGADETSALQVVEHDGSRTVTAHGEHGGWLFERVQAATNGALRAAARRLAEGAPMVRLTAAGGAVELRRSADTRAWRHGASVGASHLQLRYVPASGTAATPERLQPVSDPR